MSVFNCSINFKEVKGDSYQTTYNKLLSQGFIDKYLNIKVDIATWRKGRSELNEEASAKLGQKVNLFDEKRLLSGIRAVPNMKLFGMVDQMKSENIIDYQPQFVRDEIGIDAQGDSVTNDLDPLESKNIYTRIYESISQKESSVIPTDKIKAVQDQIDEFNELKSGKVLSLIPVGNGVMIKTEYNYNYLYGVNLNQPIEDIEEDDTPTESNSNFGLKCITG